MNTRILVFGFGLPFKLVSRPNLEHVDFNTTGLSSPNVCNPFRYLLLFFFLFETIYPYILRISLLLLLLLFTVQ